MASKPRGLSPSQRFRLEQWAPRLERDHGITLDIAPFESERLSRIINKPGRLMEKALLVSRDFVRRAGIVPRVSGYDAVVVHREAALIGPAIYERLIAATGKPIIFDFDDSIWSRAQAQGNGIFSRLHFFGKTSTLCRIAAACTAGNEFLAAYARARNSNTFVVPTTIELDDYPVVAEPRSQSPFVVCWTGSTSTLAHFEHARPALERVARQLRLQVKVICNCPPDREIPGAEMRFVPWIPANEAQEIGDCHVGIMPLPDDEVTRGKCGLKALQVMATGRPVVISPVGVNVEIVHHGRNGFLAGTDTDFANRLLELAGSPELRARLGAAGRRTVEDRYSAAIGAAKFARVVRGVVARTREMGLQKEAELTDQERS